MLSEASSGNNFEILIAEDNPVNRELVCMFLTKRGFHFQTASDGREAVELAQKNNFALIVMDVAMPFMNGCQATAIIRNSEGTQKHTPIIALTAYGSMETRQACLASGMDEVLIKPIRARDFFATLDRYLHCG